MKHRNGSCQPHSGRYKSSSAGGRNEEHISHLIIISTL